MVIEITGAARKVEIPKRTQDGRIVKLIYTFVPTTHGTLVMFDKFARKTRHEAVLEAISRALMGEAKARSFRVRETNAGKYRVMVKEKGLQINPFLEALILEDLHHNGVRCEPPLAVLLAPGGVLEQRHSNILLTIASPALTYQPQFGSDTLRTAKKIRRLGYMPINLQVIGKPGVVIDVELFERRPTLLDWMFRPKGLLPRRIEERAKTIWKCLKEAP